MRVELLYGWSSMWNKKGAYLQARMHRAEQMIKSSIFLPSFTLFTCENITNGKGHEAPSKY